MRPRYWRSKRVASQLLALGMGNAAMGGKAVGAVPALAPVPMTRPLRAPAASSIEVALTWPPWPAFDHADSPRSHRDSSSAPASVTPTAAAFAVGTAAFADGTAAHAAHGGALSFSFYSASFSKFSYDYFGVEGAERKEEAWEAFRVAATLCAALIAAHSVAVGYICWRDLTGQWDKYQLIPERAPELGKVYWKGYKKFVFDIVFMLLPALTLVARFRLGAVQHATEHDPHWLSFVKQFVGYVSLFSYQLF